MFGCGNFSGGPTLFEYVAQLKNKVNEIISGMNALGRDVQNVRQVPEGGELNEVLTKTPGGYTWKPSQGGGGGGSGDVLLGGDNVLTGKNTFTQPVIAAPSTASNEVVVGAQLTELGDEVNTVAGRVTTVEGNVKPLIETVGTLSGTVGTLQSAVQTNATNISNVATTAKENAEAVGAHATQIGEINRVLGGLTYVPGFTVNDDKKVLTVVKTAEQGSAGLQWKTPQGGGGGTGDVTEAGDNVFTGNNTFANPVAVADGVKPGDAATFGQLNKVETRVGVAESAIKNASGEIERIESVTLPAMSEALGQTETKAQGNATAIAEIKNTTLPGITQKVDNVEGAAAQTAKDVQPIIENTAASEGDVLTITGNGSGKKAFGWKKPAGGGGNNFTLHFSWQQDHETRVLGAEIPVLRNMEITSSPAYFVAIGGIAYYDTDTDEFYWELSTRKFTGGTDPVVLNALLALNEYGRSNVNITVGVRKYSIKTSAYLEPPKIVGAEIAYDGGDNTRISFRVPREQIVSVPYENGHPCTVSFELVFYGTYSNPVPLSSPLIKPPAPQDV